MEAEHSNSNPPADNRQKTPPADAYAGVHRGSDLSTEQISGRMGALENIIRAAFDELEEIKRSCPPQTRDSAPTHQSELQSGGFDLKELKALRAAAASADDWRALTQRLEKLSRSLGPEWRCRGELNDADVVAERSFSHPVYTASFGADGQSLLVVTGDRFADAELARIDLTLADGARAAKGSTIRSDSRMRRARVSPDGNVAALAFDDRVAIYALPSGQAPREILSIPVNHWDVSCLAFTPDSKQVAIGLYSSWKSRLALHSVEDGALAGYYDLKSERCELQRLAVSSDGKRIAAIWSISGHHKEFGVQVLSLEHLPERNRAMRSLHVTPPSEQGSEPKALAFAPGGELYVGDALGIIRSGSAIAENLKPVMSPAEQRSYYAYKAIADSPAEVRHVAVSPSGQTLAVATSDGFLRVFDLKRSWEDGSPAVVSYYKLEDAVDPPEESEISTIAFSQCGGMLAIGSTKGTVRVFGGKA